MAENVKKYHQIKGACLLFDETRLYLDIRDFGEGPQVEAIMDGTYICPENTGPEVKKLLRNLQRSTTVSDKEPLTLMSLDAYRESCEIVKENISS